MTLKNQKAKASKVVAIEKANEKEEIIIDLGDYSFDIIDQKAKEIGSYQQKIQALQNELAQMLTISIESKGYDINSHEIVKVDEKLRKITIKKK